MRHGIWRPLSLLRQSLFGEKSTHRGSPDERAAIASRHKRRSLVTLLAMAAILPFLLWGTRRAVESMFNAPLHWIPPGFEARRQFDEFVRQFQSQEMIVVSWPGCTVDDERLERFAEALLSPDAGETPPPSQALFTHVLSGYRLLRQLMDEPLNLSRPAAIRRLRGSLVGRDRRTSCAVVMLTRHGAIQRREALAAILAAAKTHVGLERHQLRLAGPAINGMAIDAESIRSIRRYALPSAAISLVVCWFCLRSLWMTVPVIIVAAVGQTLMLSSVFFTGETMNAVLIVLPPLAFVLTVSAGIHLVNYFYEALSDGGPADATRRAVRNAWSPCFIAAATTAIGLGSLLVSDIYPVRQFGALAAIGVMITFLALFLLLPGAMETWPWSASRASKANRAAAAGRARATWDAWHILAAAVCRMQTSIAVGSLVLVVLCSVGLFWVRTSIDDVSLLLSENRNVQDQRWFQRHLAPLVPVEVIVYFDRNHPSNMVQRLQLVQRIQEEVGKIDIVDGAMSAATFVPPIPRGSTVGAVVRQRVLNRHLESRRAELAEIHYLHEAGRRQLWRVSARAQERSDVDYGRFLARLRERVEPILTEYRGKTGDGISATYTGVTSLVYAVQQELLRDLFASFTMALILVALTMILVLRSVLAGLVAMIPNVFPALTLFGSMGWLGIDVDIGSVMTASVALGIAVDGTIHFLSWFRREVRSGRSRSVAIEYVYRHCGRALTQTTIVCALGLLVYCVSGFVPARRFSWMLLLLLLAAMVGDLILLPALLVGPLGKLFVGRGKSEPAEPPAPDRTLGDDVPRQQPRRETFATESLAHEVRAETSNCSLAPENLKAKSPAEVPRVSVPSVESAIDPTGSLVES